MYTIYSNKTSLHYQLLFPQPVASASIQDVGNSPPMTYPDYQPGEARKQSFHVNAWPYQIDPSPKAMAEAGFFYTGTVNH